MDTQAMTSGDGYPSFDIQAQRDAIPPMKTNKMNLLSDAFKAELKELINEVLDERELRVKLNGPYDFPEDESEIVIDDDDLDGGTEWIYRNTY
tara:strand:- start:5948 stop:6226 length:279 start_codon:yes stop_codon:yes gene_type:complete